MELSAESLVESYIKLRDHKKAAKDEFEKSMERVNQALEIIENKLLDQMGQQSIQSQRTDAGTAYVRIETNVSVADEEEYLDYVSKVGWEALDIKANKTYVKKLMEEGKDIPPGLKITQIRKIGVRRPNE